MNYLINGIVAVGSEGSIARKQYNLQEFMRIYSTHLRNVVISNSNEYDYGIDAIPDVVNQMKQAIVNNTFNKESIPFKRTCKQLRLNHTYTDIKQFLQGET